jgi:hypothetical protein
MRSSTGGAMGVSRDMVISGDAVEQRTTNAEDAKG